MVRFRDIARANDSYYAREYEPIIQKEKEESWAEGKAEGRAEGKAEGATETTEKHVLSCYSKGMAPEDIAELLELPAEAVKAILDLK